MVVKVSYQYKLIQITVFELAICITPEWRLVKYMTGRLALDGNFRPGAPRSHPTINVVVVINLEAKSINIGQHLSCERIAKFWRPRHTGLTDQCNLFSRQKAIDSQSHP